jgi:hypothetical protein
MEVFLWLQWCFELLGELINEPKPSVVAGVLVFSAWVAQANKQFDHAGIIYPSLQGAVIARSCHCEERSDEAKRRSKATKQSS